MAKKFRFNKQIIYIVGIIIVVYLGYLLFANTMEGFKKNACSVDADCAENLCYNAGNAGQNSFCAPPSFRKEELRASPAFVSFDITKISDAGPASYWLTASDAKPPCDKNLSVCGNGSDKYICDIKANPSNCDATASCFNAGIAGQSSFCAPKEFSLAKYRAADLYKDDTTNIADEGITDWLNATILKPPCQLGAQACGNSVKYKCDTTSTTSTECNGGNCYNMGNAGQGSFCAPKGFTKSKYRLADKYANDDSAISSVYALVDWATSASLRPTCLDTLGNCGNTS